MDSSQFNVPGADVPGPQSDPRLQPTPDYGTLGPGSDIQRAGPESASGPNPALVRALRLKPLFAIASGVFLAVMVGSVGNARAARERLAQLLSLLGNNDSNPTVVRSAKDPGQLDRLRPQKQAEALLELAVSHSDGAVEQISARADDWRGKLHWNPQIANLTTAALNSNDMHVRESGIEVQLAAYGMAKNPSTVDYLVGQADSSNHAHKIWALWTLGEMANRGIETERIVQVLTAHMKDPDVDSRRWAVEGLALVGTTPTITPLLETMHDDPSPLVRERAACSLAESGMLSHEQRLTAVPQLLNYSDDPSLDAQTHAWAFQALADITGQHLPHDASAWRSWYESNR
jgi:HEAT repeat protein